MDMMGLDQPGSILRDTDDGDLYTGSPGRDWDTVTQ